MICDLCSELACVIIRTSVGWRSGVVDSFLSLPFTAAEWHVGCSGSLVQSVVDLPSEKGAGCRRVYRNVQEGQ